jgi:hypothetical protein
MALHCEATPLLIGEANALVAEFLTQGTVLGLEILDDLELFLVDPTGENGQHEVPRRHRDHDATLTVLVQSGGLERRVAQRRQTQACRGTGRIVARMSDLAARGLHAEFSVE